MLSPNDLSLLYKIISDKNQTFENISKVFQLNFNKDSQIKVSTTLLILLKDNLLNIYQRINSYYILYIISKKEKKETNPYLSIILESLQNSNDKKEQNFLIDFLLDQIKYLNISVDKYLKEKPIKHQINTTQFSMLWDKYYKEILKQKNINANKDGKIRPVIYDEKNIISKNVNNSPNFDLVDIINNNQLNSAILTLNYYKTNYMTYSPIYNEFLTEEPIWFLPSLKHNFLWDEK